MPHRKKIIILTSTGGGGHITATNALIEHLGAKYNLEPIYPLKTFLSPIDIFSTATFGRWDGEQTYNYFVRKGCFRLINSFAKFGRWYFTKFNKRSTRLMREYLQEQKPDLVISLIPLVNRATLKACKDLNIPFLLSPTDLNATYFLFKTNKPAYEKFLYTMPFEDEKIRAIIKPAHIPESQVRITGFLVRPGFLNPKSTEEKDAIKHTFGIPMQKPVILLLMGAQGSDGILNYARMLTQLATPAHLLICIGKCQELEEKINHTPFPDHITHTALGYTDHIPHLFAISDILITKAGSVSFAEALYSGLPMLVDTTNHMLEWEQFNVDFMTRNGFGKRIDKLDELSRTVDNLLANKTEYEAIKQRIKDFPKKNGLEEITKLIEELLAN